MTSEEIFKESAEYLAGKLKERQNELVLKLPEIYITDVRAAYYAGLKSGLRHHSHDYLVKTVKLKKRIAELEAGGPKWHKPSEKLPEECTTVLACEFNNEEPSLYRFVTSDQWEWLPRRIAVLNNAEITKWCEIPKYTEE